MKFLTVILGSVFLLAACSPRVPDSGAGVDTGSNFSTYQDLASYRAGRDAVLVDNKNTPSTNTPIATTPIAGPETGAIPVDGEVTTEQRQIALNNPTISDEQDFSAVADRESIESDAQRLRAQREAMQIIEPTAVPTKTGPSGPNIVQYAITTKNPLGQKVYRRGLVNNARFARNCAKFKSPDLAQEGFLAAGGPQRDRLGLDPDGDGFACSWDPTPFRKINAG